MTAISIEANHRSAIRKSESSVWRYAGWGKRSRVSNLSRLGERDRRSVLDTFSGEILGFRSTISRAGTRNGQWIEQNQLNCALFPFAGVPPLMGCGSGSRPTFDRYVAPPPLSSLEK